MEGVARPVTSRRHLRPVGPRRGEPSYEALELTVETRETECPRCGRGGPDLDEADPGRCVNPLTGDVLRVPHWQRIAVVS